MIHLTQSKGGSSYDVIRRDACDTRVKGAQVRTSRCNARDTDLVNKGCSISDVIRRNARNTLKGSQVLTSLDVMHET